MQRGEEGRAGKRFGRAGSDELDEFPVAESNRQRSESEEKEGRSRRLTQSHSS
jgi:hypothetical protein